MPEPTDPATSTNTPRRIARWIATRALPGLLLFAALPGAVSAAVAYAMLNGTPWTDHQPEVPAGPRPTATPAPAPVPTPTRSPSTSTGTQGDTSPWALGSCITPTTTATPCTPGAWRILVIQHNPTAHPCGLVPEGERTVRTSEYALCVRDVR